MTTAALYLRVSTDKQTVDNQRAPLLALAEARGWTPRIYEETGSAVKARPVFDSLMADAKAGRVRAVVVVALDRLGRSMSGVIATVRELDRVGCVVVSLRESWLDTGGPARDLLLAVFGWVAQEERRILVERTIAGQDRARRQGTRSGKAIGRPRASSIMLGAGARWVAEGRSIRAAAKLAGVGEATLRRHLEALDARQDEDGGGAAQ
ncbi:recombinase family protein [Corallococcus silvisoli]|uniref:recombinase family protein n=1 Tax=Corallococcus silvisoli TaxID=2697031 RepID=UPI001377BACD|nr:recombinase family protein [Corallococcus silvisoli]NBD09642.1 recombinase family protein [Corallococcus silvisoli]